MGLGGAKFFFHFVFHCTYITRWFWCCWNILWIKPSFNYFTLLYLGMFKTFFPICFHNDHPPCVCANKVTYKFSLITFAMLFATLVQYKTFVEWEAYVHIWTTLFSLCPWTLNTNVRHFGEFNYTYFTWTFYAYYFFFLHL